MCVCVCVRARSCRDERRLRLVLSVCVCVSLSYRTRTRTKKKLPKRSLRKLVKHMMYSAIRKNARCTINMARRDSRREWGTEEEEEDAEEWAVWAAASAPENQRTSLRRYDSSDPCMLDTLFSYSLRAFYVHIRASADLLARNSSLSLTYGSKTNEITRNCRWQHINATPDACILTCSCGTHISTAHTRHFNISTFSTTNTNNDDDDDDDDDARTQFFGAGGFGGGDGFGPEMFFGGNGGSFGGGSFRSGSMGGGMPGMYQQRVRKQDPIVQNLKCSLNELYSGAQRKLKVSRKVMVDERRRREMEEVLTVDVKPGWKAGTKITFNNKGDEYPGTEPADIIFVIEEKRHSVYTRSGNDLVYRHRCSLNEALTGMTISLTTLDNRSLNVQVTEVVNPKFTKIVRGEGMPISKRAGQKGDLKIEFDIQFPRVLSDEKKNQIKQLL